MTILIRGGMSERGASWKSCLRCPFYAKLKADGVPECEERDALVKGSLVHVGAAHVYARKQAQQLGNSPHDFYEPDEAIRLYALEEYDRSVREEREGAEMWLKYDPTARAAIRAYQAEYLTERMEILGVEHLVEHHVKGPNTGKWYKHTMRLDLLARIDGRYWVIDHKCEPASTRVMTPHGPETVGALRDRAAAWVCAASVDGQAAWATARAPVAAGVQDVYRVKLSDGTVEHHGYNHPLLTERGWVRAEDVEVGDWVATVRPPENEEVAVPDQILAVLGFVLTDGSWSEGGSLVVTAHYAPTRRFLTDQLDALGDAWATVTHRGRPVGVRIHAGGRAIDWIRKVGALGGKAAVKALPGICYQLSRRQARILLGTLWEGDGAAAFGTPKGAGRRPVRIVFSSRSEAMAEGVRYLLGQAGIPANWCPTTAAGEPYFQVAVVGRRGKREFMRQAIAGDIWCPITVRGGRVTRAGRVLEPLSRLYDSLEEGPGQMRTEAQYGAWDYRGRGRVKDPWWESGVRWVKVQAKVFAGREECYDIEVPGPSTFLTHTGLVTHNTTSRNKKAGFELSMQIIAGCHWGYQHYGADFGGFMINGIQIRNHAADCKFLRWQPRVAPFAIGRFPLSVEFFEENWASWQERYDSDPANYPPVLQEQGPCMDRYGPCGYRKICRWGMGTRGRDE